MKKREKVEFGIYIGQYFLLVLLILLLIGFIVILMGSLYYQLTIFYSECIIGIITSGLLLNRVIVFPKFKELRKRFRKKKEP